MKFVTQDNALLIQLEGMERVWALKGHLHVPRTAVLDVDYNAQRPAVQDFWGYLRIPGTSLPWRFLAGTFWRNKEREFWFVRMKHLGVMLIELKPDADAYRRIRIGCDPETAQAVADWWHHGKQEQA
jgi:hypothetical protein